MFLVCVWVCVFVCVFVCLWVSVCVYVSVCSVSVYLCVCVVWLYVSLWVYMGVCLRESVYVSVCVLVCVWAWIGLVFVPCLEFISVQSSASCLEIYWNSDHYRGPECWLVVWWFHILAGCFNRENMASCKVRFFHNFLCILVIVLRGPSAHEKLMIACVNVFWNLEKRKTTIKPRKVITNIILFSSSNFLYSWVLLGLFAWQKREKLDLCFLCFIAFSMKINKRKTFHGKESVYIYYITRLREKLTREFHLIIEKK